MIYSYIAPALKDELGKFKSLVKENEAKGKKTVVFCEDRLTLVAERAVCEAVGGTFNTAVYTFARFLKNESKANSGVISSQGSAMAIRAIIEAEGEENLQLFRKFSLAASAAQALYDTIAILYASCIDIKELGSVDTGSFLLNQKLHDISYIYVRYMDFLKTHNKMDRNMYLRSLPDIIMSSKKTVGADIIILGFQAFTGTMVQCVKACMQAGANVYGLFTDGSSEIYAKEANAVFCGLAGELHLDCVSQRAESTLAAEAEHIRKNLFDPQSFARQPMLTDKVFIFEGLDEEQEFEFIAANIKKHITDDGIRYANISVMLPSADYARGTLARVFGAYKIPYYVDERHSLESHPLTQFICSYIECAAGGCAPEDVCDIAGSFLFGGTQKERDIFRNYILRCADFRGGVKREPLKDVCDALGFDFEAVTSLREKFIKGLKCLPSGRAEISDWSQGIAKLMELFCCKEALKELADAASKDHAAQSRFYARAYDGVMSVIHEAEEIVPYEKYDARQYKKLIKSGFAAAEISLIPPKTDAVFVGDITATVNAGSEVLFACGLTDGIPPAGADTALLTDREITALDKLKYPISPKISQVNRRMRETVALNLCAFNRRLYATYPAQSGGQEQTKSEIISYLTHMFTNGAKDGKGNFVCLHAVKYEEIAASQRGIPFYCSEKIPALNWLAANSANVHTDSGVYSAVYNVVKENGGEKEAVAALTPPEPKGKINCARQLFTGGRQSVSPSLLETYFACPYKNFLSRGIWLSDRKEGAANPLDTGNIVHEVLNRLEKTFKTYGDDADTEIEKQRAAEEAENIVRDILSRPEYSILDKSTAGEYMVKRLVAEVKEVAAGACEQILAGSFRVEAAEKWCELPLTDDLKVGGRIDRIDRFAGGTVVYPGEKGTVREVDCPPMVRVIDYKTGGDKAVYKDYYAGKKLQLPLYLLAAKGDSRAAGTYYFPANIDYEDKKGVFTLLGFMDKSGEVIAASDKGLAYNGASRYFSAKYSGKMAETNMPQEVFDGFIGYSRLIAKQGADEITGGCIAPSPYENACEFCSYGGMCGFSKEQSDVRSVGTISGADIAQITVNAQGSTQEDGNGN